MSAIPAASTAATVARPRFFPRDMAALAFLLVAAPAAVWLGIRIGQPGLFPVLTALPAILVFLDRINAGRLSSALGLMVAWSTALSVAVILNTRWNPAGTETVIWNGATYRDEMLAWVRTGVGAEGSPRLFLPQHALHYGVFL
ncbi:MAG TPA: hypothetical protein VF720_10100, partial [Candidatus Eisenbacteria bacterium]